MAHSGVKSQSNRYLKVSEIAGGDLRGIRDTDLMDNVTQKEALVILEATIAFL